MAGVHLRCVAVHSTMLAILLLVIQLTTARASETNLALGKPTTMSAVHDNKVGALAVDGNHNSDYYSGVCMHTSGTSSDEHWLKIDLLSTYWIQSVKVTNRGDCCGLRLQAFEIRVSASANDTFVNDSGLCYYQEAGVVSGASPRFYCNKPLWGRYVTLSLRLRPDISARALHVCEVEVYGGRYSGYELFAEGSREDCVYTCLMRPGCVAFTWTANCCYIEMSDGTELVEYILN